MPKPESAGFRSEPTNIKPFSAPLSAILFAIIAALGVILIMALHRGAMPRFMTSQEAMQAKLTPSAASVDSYDKTALQPSLAPQDDPYSPTVINRFLEDRSLSSRDQRSVTKEIPSS